MSDSDYQEASHFVEGNISPVIARCMAEDMKTIRDLRDSNSTLYAALERATAELRRVKVCLSETVCEELEQVQADCEAALNQANKKGTGHE